MVINQTLGNREMAFEKWFLEAINLAVIYDSLYMRVVLQIYFMFVYFC